MRVLAELLKHKLIDVEVWRFGSYSVTHEGWTEYEASSSGMAARILQPAQEPGAQPVAQREETATPSAVAALPVVTGGTRAPPTARASVRERRRRLPSLPRAPRHVRFRKPRGTRDGASPAARAVVRACSPRGEQGAAGRDRHRLEGPETFHSAEQVGIRDHWPRQRPHTEGAQWRGEGEPPVRRAPRGQEGAVTMTAQHSTVGGVMTRDVVTVRPDTPFKEITSVLSSHGISAVPVADEGGAPMGLVSEADLLRKQTEQPDAYGGQAAPPGWPRERAKARAENAAGLMTSPVATAHADWPVAQAAREMDRHHVKRLVVVDESDHIVGIVSRPDLLRVFLRPDEEIRQEIRDEVLTAILRLSGQEVNAQVHDGVVTLRGEVDKRSTAQIAEQLAKGVDGVVTVRPMIDYAIDDRAAEGRP
ncbi:hypothetical protein GCM10010390_87810 [Streptomyces mordarskii]